MKYRKKPLVIDAVQWLGTPESFSEILALGEVPWLPGDEPGSFIIKTLEGNHIVSPGDYVIKGVAGEFYPCKQAIFDKTYEIVFDED